MFAFIVITAMGVGVASFVATANQLGFLRTQAVLTTIATMGTFVLACVAAALSVLVYWDWAQRLKLSPEVHFPGCKVNQPEFASVWSDGRWELRDVHRELGGLKANVRIRNQAKAEASGVVVTMLFWELRGVRSQMDWQDAGQSDSGVWLIRWQAGPDKPVHGRYYLNLPEVDLSGSYLHDPSDSARLDVEIAAQGFLQRWELPIRISR